MHLKMRPMSEAPLNEPLLVALDDVRIGDILIRRVRSGVDRSGREANQDAEAAK